jgi:hypothetical protein
MGVTTIRTVEGGMATSGKAFLFLIGLGAWIGSSSAAAPPSPRAAPVAGETEYTGYAGRRWSTDYGVGRGRCDRDRVLVHASGTGSDLVARHQEHLRNRTVGIIGAESSALLVSTRLPRTVGRLDVRDRACLSQVLEFGAPGRDVSWDSREAGVRYVATLRDEPLPAAQSRCRVLLLVRLPVTAPAATPLTSRRDVERFVACDTGGGAWAFR